MGTAIVLLVVVVVVLCAIRSTVKKILYGGGCCGERERVKRVKVADQDPSHYPYRYLLSIEGMQCANCKQHVENALDKMDGLWAKVDLAQGKARVFAKQPMDEQQLRKTIWEAGYQMTGCEKDDS